MWRNTHFNVERLINCRTDNGTKDIITMPHSRRIFVFYFFAIGPVDGKWGKWSEWSECLSKYSYGTQIRYRFCDSPTPKYSGKYCEVNIIEFIEAWFAN